MQNDRILIVTPYYDGVGGVALAVRQLAAEFRALGHDVLILARGDSLHVVADRHDEGVYRVRLRVPFGTLRSWVAFVAMMPLTLFCLRAFLVRQDVRLVMIQYTNAAHFYFGLLRRSARWKLFAAFQGDDAHRIETCGPLYRVLYNILLRRVDGVIAVSRSLMRKVKSAVPAASPHNAIIPNGAPGSSEPANDGAVRGDYAIAVGLLQPRKGFDILIRAQGILRRRGIRQRLLIVGNGPERDALNELARQEMVADDIVFVGEKPHADVIALMQGSRFFVLASRAEGLPLVVVEAMMCGRPVVATSIDGIPEIVAHESNGLLVEPEQETQLADAMQRMIQDDALCATLGAAARRVAQGFEWRHIAAKYIDHFKTAPVRW